MTRPRRTCPGPFQDAVYDLFVRKGMDVFQIYARFDGQVTLDEIRKSLAFAASRPVRSI